MNKYQNKPTSTGITHRLKNFSFLHHRWSKSNTYHIYKLLRLMLTHTCMRFHVVMSTSFKGSLITTSCQHRSRVHYTCYTFQKHNTGLFHSHVLEQPFISHKVRNVMALESQVFVPSLLHTSPFCGPCTTLGRSSMRAVRILAHRMLSCIVRRPLAYQKQPDVARTPPPQSKLYPACPGDPLTSSELP